MQIDRVAEFSGAGLDGESSHQFAPLGQKLEMLYRAATTLAEQIDSQRAQHLRRVAPQPQPGAAGRLRCRFIEFDVNSRGAQRDSRGNSTDARARDQNPRRAHWRAASSLAATSAMLGSDIIDKWSPATLITVRLRGASRSQPLVLLVKLLPTM